MYNSVLGRVLPRKCAFLWGFRRFLETAAFIFSPPRPPRRYTLERLAKLRRSLATFTSSFRKLFLALFCHATLFSISIIKKLRRGWFFFKTKNKVADRKLLFTRICLYRRRVNIEICAAGVKDALICIRMQMCRQRRVVAPLSASLFTRERRLRIHTPYVLLCSRLLWITPPSFARATLF